jgi:hypothetical protein
VTVIRLPQAFANRRMAESVRESFQTVGEMCIFIKMLRVANEDLDKAVPERGARCPRCWDPFYKESSDMACPVCGGTGLAPSETSRRGMKQFGRAWCVVSDNVGKQGELIRKYGEWMEDDREMQLEAGIEPDHHDYLVRVQRWSSDGRPLELGARFQIDNPSPVSMRSGNEYGQSAYQNVIGYQFRAKRLRDYNPVAFFEFPSNQPVPRYF